MSSGLCFWDAKNAPWFWRHLVCWSRSIVRISVNKAIVSFVQLLQKCSVAILCANNLRTWSIWWCHQRFGHSCECFVAVEPVHYLVAAQWTLPCVSTTVTLLCGCGRYCHNCVETIVAVGTIVTPQFDCSTY